MRIREVRTQEECQVVEKLAKAVIEILTARRGEESIDPDMKCFLVCAIRRHELRTGSMPSTEECILMWDASVEDCQTKYRKLREEGLIPGRADEAGKKRLPLRDLLISRFLWQDSER